MDQDDPAPPPPFSADPVDGRVGPPRPEPNDPEFDAKYARYWAWLETEADRLAERPLAQADARRA